MTNSLYASRLLAAEVLAYCVCDLFPGAQLVSGGVSEIGFHYDFSVEQPLDENAIPLIETTIKAIVKQGRPIKVHEMMRENAADLLRFHGQSVAALLLEEDPNNIVPILEMGKFYDHLPMGKKVDVADTTEAIGVVKILAVTHETAYIPGTGNLPITRVKATAFPDPQSLKQFLKKNGRFKQGHRLLMEEMKLAIPMDEGYCWLPKGYLLRELLLEWWSDQVRSQGSQRIASPGMIKTAKEQVLSVEFEGENYQIFSDRAEAHARLYARTKPTYKEMPVRYAEYGEKFAPVRRQDLDGMLRSSLFYADSLNQFCEQEQVPQELISYLQFLDKIVKIVGFEYQWHLVASRGSRSAGTLAKWDLAVDWLMKAIEACGFAYVQDGLNEAVIGPRLEIRISDPLGQQWPGPSLSVDLKHPMQCKLYYKDAHGREHTPVMLSGSVFGSIERFTALLLEHFAGQLPLWLAPEQVRVLPVGGRKGDYANALLLQIKEAGFRANVDHSDEKLSGKVHAAEREKVPYIVIVGDQEEKEALITLRSCRQGGMQSRIRLEHFLEQLSKDEQEFKEES